MKHQRSDTNKLPPNHPKLNHQPKHSQGITAKAEYVSQEKPSTYIASNTPPQIGKTIEQDESYQIHQDNHQMQQTVKVGSAHDNYARPTPPPKMESTCNKG